MNLAIHTQLLPDAGAGKPAPEWVHLLPAGEWRGVDGRGPYRTPDPAKLIAASMAAGRIVLDENHSTELAPKHGTPSPARGWIDRMEARADGIWGHVDWCPTGMQLMTERAYRAISPVFWHEANGDVTRIKNAALTNNANCGQLATLHSQQDCTMDVATLRTALGLADTAGEPDILGAIKGLRDSNATLVRNAAEAAGVTATDAPGLVLALQTLKTSGAGAGDLAAKVIALQTQLSTLQAEGGKARATAVIDKAIADGKPILPLRDHLIARHVADPAGVEKELAALPSINAGGVVLQAQQQTDGDETLTDDEKAAADKMGISHDKMKAQKKANKEKQK